MSKTIQKAYRDAVDAYCSIFADKHDFYYDKSEWIGDFYGETIVMGDYFISFSDIIYDIDNDINESEFLKWYDYSIDLAYLDSFDYLTVKKVNYSSWCKGFRPYTDEQMIELKNSIDRIDRAKQLLIKTLEEFNEK